MRGAELVRGRGLVPGHAAADGEPVADVVLGADREEQRVVVALHVADRTERVERPALERRGRDIDAVEPRPVDPASLGHDPQLVGDALRHSDLDPVRQARLGHALKAEECVGRQIEIVAVVVGGADPGARDRLEQHADRETHRPIVAVQFQIADRPRTGQAGFAVKHVERHAEGQVVEHIVGDHRRDADGQQVRFARIRLHGREFIVIRR